MSAATQPTKTGHTAEASRAKRERRNERRAEVEKVFGSSLEVTGRLAMSEKTINTLPIRRIQATNKDGEPIRKWLYVWADVLAVEAELLKKATTYQDRK
jgi:hypothetical protein